MAFVGSGALGVPLLVIVVVSSVFTTTDCFDPVVPLTRTAPSTTTMVVVVVIVMMVFLPFFFLCFLCFTLTDHSVPIPEATAVAVCTLWVEPGARTSSTSPLFTLVTVGEYSWAFVR